MSDFHPADARSSEKAALLELENISVQAGNAKILHDVRFACARGEIIGLVGDNGAGKSTLVKVITGHYAPCQGMMRWNGQPIRDFSPGLARAAGIEAVYQDLALIGELSLWRNFFLGKELNRGWGPWRGLRVNAMRDVCLQELKKIGLTRVKSADAPAAVLSGGERQALAITRAAYFGAHLLLLDEPTAALSVRETRNVLDLIQSLRAQGHGIIHIDHNLAHIYPIADRIVLLSHGRVKAAFARGEIGEKDLTELLAQPASQ